MPDLLDLRAKPGASEADKDRLRQIAQRLLDLDGEREALLSERRALLHKTLGLDARCVR